MASAVRCPSCQASSADGAEFLVLERYRATGTSLLVGVDETGALLIEGIDRGEPDHLYRPELVCLSCGHQWITSREVRPSWTRTTGQ